MNTPKPSSSHRNSNIEVLRIIAMLLIVSHHYVVHSGVLDIIDPVNPTVNSIFMLLFGMWGKVAINIFVLTTGYYMCQQELTFKRIVKILLPIFFYSWIIWFVLVVYGYETFSYREACRHLFLKDLLVRQRDGFLSAYIWMVLMIPCLNIFVANASRKLLWQGILVLLTAFSICGTFLNADVFHAFFWYIILYILGAAIRLHPFDFMSSNKICVLLLSIAICLSAASVISIILLARSLGHPIRDPWWYVHDSNKLFALFVGTLAFLVARNMKPCYNKTINSIAATTFGVYLMHDSVGGMRMVLWHRIFDVASGLTLGVCLLIAKSLVVVGIVFVICSICEGIRLRFIERPLFSCLFKGAK